MPDFPQRRKSIPLVTDLVSYFDQCSLIVFKISKTFKIKFKAMILAANKRSAGVPSNRQTLNDEELVRNCYVFWKKKHYFRFYLVSSNFNF